MSRCVIDSSAGFVGHNEWTRIKCSKCVGQFRHKQSCFVAVTLSYNLSAFKRPSTQPTDITCKPLSTICHQACHLWHVKHSSKNHLYILWHTNSLCTFCNILPRLHLLQQFKITPFAPHCQRQLLCCNMFLLFSGKCCSRLPSKMSPLQLRLQWNLLESYCWCRSICSLPYPCISFLTRSMSCCPSFFYTCASRQFGYAVTTQQQSALTSAGVQFNLLPYWTLWTEATQLAN